MNRYDTLVYDTSFLCFATLAQLESVFLLHISCGTNMKKELLSIFNDDNCEYMRIKMGFYFLSRFFASTHFLFHLVKGGNLYDNEIAKIYYTSFAQCSWIKLSDRKRFLSFETQLWYIKAHWRPSVIYRGLMK